MLILVLLRRRLRGHGLLLRLQALLLQLQQFELLLLLSQLGSLPDQQYLLPLQLGAFLLDQANVLQQQLLLLLLLLRDMELPVSIDGQPRCEWQGGDKRESA